jgi:hypothetical protein
MLNTRNVGNDIGVGVALTPWSGIQIRDESQNMMKVEETFMLNGNNSHLSYDVVYSAP